MAAVRDPLLRAAQPPAVAVGYSRRPQRAGIRSRVGLGEREGPDRAARREAGNETLPLLVAAEREDRERHGARVHRDRDADSCVRSRELLEHEDVGEEVGTGAAELLGDADAHEAELAELREELAREGVIAIPRGRVRRDLGLGHLPGELLDRALLGSEREVHRPRV